MKRILLSFAAMALFAVAASLGACSADQVQADVQVANTDIASTAKGIQVAVAAACTDIAPVAAAASAFSGSNATVSSLLAYSSSICSPSGTAVASANIDASTAAWIGGIKAGLQVAANLPTGTTATVAPASSPPAG